MSSMLNKYKQLKVKIMKKFLCVFFLMCACITAMAHTYTFRATEIAIRTKFAYGWSNWSEWQRCSVYIFINCDDGVISIESKVRQVYRILRNNGRYVDRDGCKTFSFKFIDQDDDLGTMRLRIDPSGTSQIYIDFANMMWVYNVIKV